VDREALNVTAPVPFSEIAGFRLIRMLGFGGFGDVYEVERDGAGYALKLFRAELAADVDLERFRREVRALQIEHEQLVRYVDSGEAVMAGRIVHWVAMELLEGQSLRELLESAGGPLPVARACEVGRQMALGLAALHERNIAHRDVKPATCRARLGTHRRVRASSTASASTARASPPTREIGSSLLARWRGIHGSAFGARAKGP
jgi:serine/threonine protein kinase